MRTSARAGNDMVDREISHLTAAILASVPVANKDFAARELNAGAGAADKIDKPDHRWIREAVT